MLERIAAGIVIGLLEWLGKRRAVAEADVDADFLRAAGSSVREWLREDRARARRIADAIGETDGNSPPKD
jgi:hypothetical protein